MKLIPHKTCLCCKHIFFKKSNITNKIWENRNYCCRKCGKLKLPVEEYLQNKLQHILSRIIVKKSGCMEWQGALSKQGYGHTCIFKKILLTHRAVWILVYGEIPNDIDVLHSCDNPPCINPEHLFLGTNQDNIDDMKNKGRQLKGYDKYNCKVADDEKIHLLKMAKEGILYKNIAKEFGICEQNANNIALANGIRRNLVKRKQYDQEIQFGYS